MVRGLEILVEVVKGSDGDVGGMRSSVDSTAWVQGKAPSMFFGGDKKSCIIAMHQTYVNIVLDALGTHAILLEP